MNFEFGLSRLPTQIIFGEGQVAATSDVVARIGRRVLICTDSRLGGTPLVPTLVAQIRAAGVEVEVFDETQAELPMKGILDCVAHYKAFDPDVIVGLGGGSCMDMAKLVSLLLRHGGALSDYYGEFKVPGPIVPVVAIPTTSGTGSEVTPVAVLADDSRDMKVGISSPELIPHTAICDPELTLSCPSSLTAISGCDALTHAVEALSARRREPEPGMVFKRVFVGKNALSDQYALAAIRLIFQHLERAVHDGNDRQARGALMLASTLAGLAFSTAGTSAAHAIQYPVGALTHTAHGLGVAVLLPFAMEYNLAAAAKDYAEIAKVIGIVDSHIGVEQAAQTAIFATRELLANVGIPSSLAPLGVQRDQIDWIADHTLLAARLTENNPRPLTREGVVAILDHALN